MSWEATNLIRIEAPDFVAGIDWNAYYDANGVRHYKHRCAPIIKYMTKWSWDRIAMYCAKRGWKWKIM